MQDQDTYDRNFFFVRLALTAVAGLEFLIAMLFLFLVGWGCDESCDPGTGRWQDTAGAWQWDAFAAAGLGCALLAVVTMACFAAPRAQGIMFAVTTSGTAIVWGIAIAAG